MAMIEGERLQLGNLPNKPLVEAVFELRWALEGPATGFQTDRAWQLLPGIFYGKLKADFPTSLNLPAAQLPDGMTPHMVRNQFRAGPGTWPAIQLGPGVITVNHAEGYTVWGDFKAVILRAVDALEDSYPNPLSPIHVQLRYINAVPFDSANDLSSFLSDNLHVVLQTPSFSNGEGGKSVFNAVHLTLTFPLTKPKGTGTLLIGNGLNNDTPSLVWQLTAQSDSPDVLESLSGVPEWLDQVHDLIEEWFTDLTSGPLLDSFKAG